jgi:hypothetical protein
MGPSTPCQQSNGRFNSQEIYQTYLTYLIHLAKQKGWKDEAWHWAKKLDSDPSGLWDGIKDDLVKEMKNGL